MAIQVNLTEKQQKFIEDTLEKYQYESEDDIVALILDAGIFAMQYYRKQLYNFFRDREELLLHMSAQSSSNKMRLQEELEFVSMYKRIIEGKGNVS